MKWNKFFAIAVAICFTQIATGQDTEKEKGLADSGNKPARSKSRKMNTYNDIYQMIRGEVSGVVVSGRSILIQQGHSFFGSSNIRSPWCQRGYTYYTYQGTRNEIRISRNFPFLL